MKTRLVVPSLISLLAFGVYLRTIAPAVGFIDSGELAAVASTLGVAHPTGYALFTLLGSIFAHVPLAGSVIVRLNTMAALLCAGGVFVFYHVVRRFLLMSIARGEGAPRVAPAAAAASLLLAFSETWWTQAVAVEVYALHVLFLCLILFAFLRANSPLQGEPRSRAWWYAFAFFVGLSFTNHMTTVLLAPGLLFLYFRQQGGSADSWKRIARMGVPFAAGLSLVLELPLRASQSPLLNWGNPTNLERFLWHFTGKQYRSWIFSSTDVAARQLAYFYHSFPPEFAYVGACAAVPGLILLWSWNRGLAAGTVILFVSCVLYAVNYDIHDIDSYFLLAYVTTALWAAAGLFALWRWIAGAAARRRAVATAAVLLLSGVPLVVNYPIVDRSRDHLVEDYTKNMFASLEPHAVIVSFQWDYWVSASYYYQLVEGMRPDVTVIDKELLRRSWYVRELARREPWLMAGAQQEVEAFLREVSRFEHDLPYEGGLIESKYAAMIGAFLRTAFASRPVYVTGEMQFEYTRDYRRVPAGLAFRLVRDEGFHPTPFPAFSFRPFPNNGRWEQMVPRLYAEALAFRGEYYLAAGKDSAEARKSLVKALEFDPSSPIVKRLSGMLPGAR